MLIFTPANLIVDLATLEGWKAEFTWLAGLRLTLDYVLHNHNHIITILLYWHTGASLALEMVILILIMNDNKQA